uniref:Occludin n=1 Tax=Amphilophus citrinellus TaxID=61819 RepID=A0A3Q0S6J8_AMPCI
MFDKQQYESPPVYSPPFTPPPNNGFGPVGSFHDPQSDYNAYPPPPGSYYIEDRPQHFYKWLSPPGIVKAMMATVVVLCVAIFACVASTLMWDIQYGYGTGMGYYGSGMGYGSGYIGGGYGSGYGSYGGYGNFYGSGSYVSPYSAKAAMIAMAAINFIGALAFFITSFSKSNVVRSRKFFLAVLISSVLMAVLQGIINIVYIVGVNPMAQSSSSMIRNPMLVMCQSLYQTSYSQMGGVGGFPMYNQYLYHYCFVDPQEGIAMACGFLVVIALGVAAFFAQKTRGKIWRYGKPNIYWDEPFVGGKASEGRDVEEWVRDSRMKKITFPSCIPAFPLTQTELVISVPLDLDSSTNPYKPTKLNVFLFLIIKELSSPSEETGGGRKPSAHRGKRRRRNPELDESQYETEYTTGGETGNELDAEEWDSMYPEITSDAQRHDYKREFDTDLREYKRLCAEMDDINDQLNKLSRQLDTLDDTSARYQIVADEYNQLKDLKQTSDYQAKKRECRRLRHKLFHIKRMVKDYDKNH